MKNKEKTDKKHFSISIKCGGSIVLFSLILSLYFRYKVNSNFSIVLGDVGSITKTLIKGFSISSGRGLLYVSLYGLVLTIYSKNEKLKEFYSYYILALIVLTLGSLIYFII